MTDLISRANVNIAINTLLNDLQPNDAIQPSNHHGLLKDILDTLSNGLSTTLRTGNTTDGQNMTITSSSIFQFENGSNGRLQSDSLTAFRNWTLPDKNGTVAMLTDITGGDNISSANLTFDGSHYVDLSSFSWTLGGLAPIGLEKISLQNDTLIKGSNNASGTSGFKVTDINDNSLLDIKNNGLFKINDLVQIGENTVASGYFNIAHVNNDLDTQYAFAGGENGSTYINAHSFGDGISFRLSDVDKMTLRENTGLTVSTDSTITGTLKVNDIVKIGENTLASGYFNIAHSLNNLNTEYIIAGGQGGDTYLNAHSSLGLNFRLSGVDKVKLLPSTGLNILTDLKTTGNINALNLPTSSAGLVSGDIWNNSGVLNIV